MTTPISVYLDVDGVLSPIPPLGEPLPASEGGWPGGYQAVEFGFEIPYAPELVQRLNALQASGRIRFVWATSWFADAIVLAERIGLDAQGWPVLEARVGENLDWWWKADSIARDHAVHQSQFVWLDDDLYLKPVAQEWARNSGGHCLCPHPASGILPAHMAFIEALT